MVRIDNHAEVRALLGNNVRSYNTRRIRKTGEVIPSTSPSVPVATSSKRKASVAPRYTGVADRELIVDPFS